MESCIPTRTVSVYANDKPRFTKEVKNKLVAENAGFRSGDGEEFRRAKYEARRAIARAKAEYKDKLQDQFASNNTHAVSVARPTDHHAVQGEIGNYQQRPNASRPTERVLRPF